jgi:integrase
MALYKRGGSPYWWVKFTVNGERVQRSTETTDRKAAARLLAQWQTEVWNREYLGVSPSHLWEEAVLRYLRETVHKASRKTDEVHLRWLHPFLEGRELLSINRDRIEVLISAAQAEGASNTSVNRRLEVLRAILRKARDEWEWIDRAPKVRMLREPLGRERYLREGEILALLRELPEHQRSLMVFGLATGLRQGNIKRLRWAHVDLANRFLFVPAAEAKARRPIGVPLNATALGVLKAQQGKHLEFVFAYRGKPIRQVSTKSWRAALKRAGLEDVRWHDLRHTFASLHAQNGVPSHALQQLGAWNTSEMVRRYAHLSVEHLRPYADQLSSKLEGVAREAGYILATPEGVH